MEYEKRKQKLIEKRKEKPVVVDLPNIFREHGLPYLPAKSLHRFKSVCSIWKFWISNPFFSHRQSSSFRAISGVFYQPAEPSRKPGSSSSSSSSPRFLSVDASSYGVPDPSLGFLPEPVRLKQSSNGLLCCWSPESRTFYLCNPVTEQWRALPKPTRDHGKDPDVVLKVESGSIFHFESEFSLVCTIVSRDGDTEFDIFSSKTNSWELARELIMNDNASTSFGYAMYAPATVRPNSGVYANKVAYWLMTQRSSLLAFDLVKDRASFVNLPLIRTHSGARLGEVDGTLCLATCQSRKLELFLLSSPTARWSQPRTVSIPHTTTFKPEVLAVQGDGVVIYVDGRLFKYSLATGNFTTTSTTTNQAVSADLLSNTSTLLPYINSLVSF